MNLRKYLYLLTVCGLFIAGSAAAGGIAHWVDESGATHYGDPQFAPPGEGSLIEVAAINIMDVPVAPPRKVQGTPPRVVTIERPAKRNKRGWQGYYSSSRARNSSGRRRGR
ncbi:MAG: hypothetical protein ACE1ZA_19060 [Pseudomonadales bacterium]